MPPAMYAMELIGVNELIDTEIKNLYNNIVTTTEEEERQKLFNLALPMFFMMPLPK